MHVKEWRLEARSEGKWTGVMGQLMNSKLVRVKRDLRAVTEISTSAEQLARRRERRWRKGLEPSHTAAVWREEDGGEQGSLEVGMLRDWRAVSCFGSRGEEDEEEEGGDFVGEGEMEGEGDGSEWDLVGDGAEGDLVGDLVLVDGDFDGDMVLLEWDGIEGDVVGEGAEGGLVGEMGLVVLGGEREEVRDEEMRRESKMGRNGGHGAIAELEREGERERDMKNL